MAVYNPGFARIYNTRWIDFAKNVAPQIQSFYESRSAGSVDRRLLDLCCGTGQLALHFLAQSYKVVGLDLSPAMLSYAAENARAYIEAGQASFIEGNAADFSLPETFGLVVSTFDALNHLSDFEALAACFGCVYRVLTDGGWFIFDLNTVAGLRNRWTGVTVQDTDEWTVITRGFMIEEQRRAYTRITGYARRDDGLYERFEQTAHNLLLDLEAVVAALRAVGFEYVHCARMNALDIPIETPESENHVWIVAHKMGSTLEFCHPRAEEG